MKKSKTSLLLVLMLLMCTSSSSRAYEQTVDILHVTKIDSSISIILDYNLSSTSQLDSNELLAVLVVFAHHTPFSIEAAMLFFHTVENNHSLFWMLGDPYIQAQNWQLGIKDEHFQTEDELLTLNFMEFQGVKDPEIEVIVLAKISLAYEINADTNDFRLTLNQFATQLPISHEFPSLEAPSKEKSSPSFTILFTLTALLTTLLILRFRRKK